MIIGKDSVLDIKLEPKNDLVISKNTETVSSSIKIVLSKKSKVSIKGYWSEDEGKKLTISNPDSSNAVVNIEQDDNVFVYEGSSPNVSVIKKFTNIAIYIIVGAALYLIVLIAVAIFVIKKLKDIV